MRRILEGWDRFWFSRGDPLPAAVFRVALGLLLLAVFAALAPNWERFYGAQGALSLAQMSREGGWQDRWSCFYWTDGLLPAKTYWWLGLACAAALTAGWHTRFAAVALCVLYASMVHRNLMVVNGEDLMLRTLLFYSCFAPLDRRLSLDSRLRRRRGEPPEDWRRPRLWPIRLMQVNIALVYLISVPNKLADGGAWLGGNAVYWAVTSSLWSRWPWPELFYGTWLCKAATYGTLLAEGAFPLLVWFPRTRLWVLIPLACLHIGLSFALQNVAFFNVSMLVALLLFLSARDLRRVWSLKEKNSKFPRF